MVELRKYIFAGNITTNSLGVVWNISIGYLKKKKKPH